MLHLAAHGIERSSSTLPCLVGPRQTCWTYPACLRGPRTAHSNLPVVPNAPNKGRSTGQS
jgi:hypothetical protein